MEGFGRQDAAAYSDIDPRAVDALVAEAVAEIDRQTATRC